MKTILIVDDEPNIIKSIARALRTAQEITHITFSDPLEAKEWIEKNSFDIGIFDYHMPLMNGAKLTSAVRNSSLNELSPIIILSGSTDPKVFKECLDAGVTEFINKPVERLELVTRVRNLIQLKDTQDKLTVTESTMEKEIEKATQRIKSTAERLNLATKGSNDGIWDWDLAEDKIYYSERWKEMLGYYEDEIVNIPAAWFGRVHPEDLRALTSAIDNHINGHSDSIQCEYRIRDRQGFYRWMLCRGSSIRDKVGKVLRIAGTQTDIHDRKLLEIQLSHNSLHDSLTGLPNRILFMERLTQSFIRYKRDKINFAVIFIDLDDFKDVNDQWGHAAGDQLLCSIAASIQRCARESDTVARLAGDEFIILMTNVEDEEGVKHFTQRLLKETHTQVNISGHSFTPSLSIGVAIINNDYVRAEDLMKDADFALYQAKANGKDQYAFFCPEMRHTAHTLYDFQTSLEQALDRNEILFHYQPILDMRSTKIVSVESLMRWHHPRYGLLQPDDFLPIAQESDLIIALGKYAVRESLRQMEEWQKMIPAAKNWYISINLAEKQLRENDFVLHVQAALADCKFPKSQIIFEIPESAVQSVNDKMFFIIHDLKKLGVRIALDDFGVGRSSLTMLMRYSFDYLKIDRSLINESHKNIFSQKMIKVILYLAKELGIEVIYEGIESQEDLKFISSIEPHWAQGFIFSRAIPPTMMIDQLKLTA